MRQEPPTFAALRRVLPGREINVESAGVGFRAQRPGGPFRGGIGVHPDISKVMVESRLHEVPRAVIQRLPSSMHRLMDDRRQRGGTGTAERLTLQEMFRAAFLTFAAGSGLTSASTFALDEALHSKIPDRSLQLEDRGNRGDRWCRSC
ncbi:MAG TPA: hypothetical protein VMH81_33890 [Bryobacteraceae bacterium]|nr:hypothetical protein [Bryobacteraceae bacterium]